MWIMLSDSFLSIVSKDCAPDELLVRARQRAHIEKVFAGVTAERTPDADYLWRAPVKKVAIIKALADEVARIDYDNFKDSVIDDDLHLAYMRVWAAMVMIQHSRRRPAARKPAQLRLKKCR